MNFQSKYSKYFTKVLVVFGFIFSFFVLTSFFGGLSNNAFAYTSPGSPDGYVNDFAKILTWEERITLENRLSEFSKQTTNEIAVVTVKSIGDETIESYAAQLFQDWQIGMNDKDNGILLLVAMDERQMRIETGYGLEGALPDATASYIIRRDITPAFQSGNYYEGLSLGLEGIISATKGEYVARPEDSAKGNPLGDDIVSVTSLVLFGFVMLQFIAAALGRSKSWWFGGVLGLIGGIIVTLIGLFGITYSIGVIVTAALTILGLIFDFIVSKIYRGGGKGKGGNSWISGGSGTNWGGGGGSSFGGFSGGSSGGGGASGRW